MLNKRIYHFIKVVVVCLSVTGGQQKQLDLNKGTVFRGVEWKKLEIGDLCERQSKY